MKKNISLISLNLSKNDITSIGIEDLKEALLNTNILEIDLSKNPLGNSGIRFLSKFLSKKLCKITKINLSNCEITGEGSVTLFRSLASNQSV